MKVQKAALRKAIYLLVVSVLFTVMVCVVDRRAIGPEGTSVGFASINGMIADAIGLNMTLDKVTDVMMLIAILVAFFFAAAGAFQLFKSKSISGVDRYILVMACVYILVAILYVVFDKVPVNYRPVIMPDETELETSFPSSHTLVICTIMGTAIVAWKKMFGDNKSLYNVLRIAAIVIMVIAVAGRIFAGVHWFTDILAGLFFAAAITMFYTAFTAD